MMEKLYYQGDHEELLRACDGVLTHIFASGELAGNIKSASNSSISRDVFEQYKPDKDHFLMHLVAMGATESYGWNRNMDGFKRAMLQRDHPTFVKNGHYFEEHRNRDPKLKRGDVKFSHYNDELDRVELLVWGDTKKASEDYEKARSGKPLSYSMSVKIPHDVCAACGHKAAKISLHCSHMKESAGQYLEEFQKYAYVDNPEGTFFDISKVRNPADRTAHYLRYMFPDAGTEELQKTASSIPIINGADWAQYEGVTLPDGDIEPFAPTAKQKALLQKIAALIDYCEHANDGTLKCAFAKATGQALFATDAALTAEELDAIRQVRPETLFYGMAKRAAVFSLPDFIAYLSGSLEERDDYAKAACACMPKMIKELLGGVASCGNFQQEFGAGSEFGAAMDPANGDEVQQFMDSVEKRFGIASEPVKSRVISITIKAGNALPEKNPVTELTDGKAEVYAEAYGQYLLKSLVDMEKFGHSIDEPKLLALASYIKN